MPASERRIHLVPDPGGTLRLHLYLAVFGAVLSTVVVPLPEEMALLGAGWLAHSGQVTLWGAFLAGWLAIVLGDATTFTIGRLFLPRLLASRIGRRVVSPEAREWADGLVVRHGFRAIVLGRFLVALRGPVYLAVGASKYPPAKFLLINGAVALVEVGIVVFAGYHFGRSGALVGKIRWIDAAIAVSIVIAFVIPVLFRWLLKRRDSRSSRSLATAPTSVEEVCKSKISRGEEEKT